MHFTRLLSFASALAYMPLILATASTTTYELCTTKYGTKSVAQPGSTTYALRTTVFETQVRTTTPVKTITPVGKTITVYQPAVAFTTVTKSPQKTATFSTTSTIVTTVTATITATANVIGATITTTSTAPALTTTTVPTSPGFTPVASGYSQEPVTYATMFTEEDPWNGKRSLETALPRRRSHNRGKVALKEFTGQKKKELVDKERRKLVARNDPLPVCSPALYPSTVTCGDIVKVRSTATVVSTAKTTVTTTLPTPTAFVTRTVTYTLTKTVCAGAAATTASFSTTLTASATVTTTSTNTQAVTVTIVDVAPAQTYYAACAADNMLNNIEGAAVRTVGYGQSNVIGSTTNGPYDCCALCLNTEGCAASFYGGNGSCFLVFNDVCDPGNQVADVKFDLNNAPNELTVMNSNCGSFQVNDDRANTIPP